MAVPFAAAGKGNFEALAEGGSLLARLRKRYAAGEAESFYGYRMAFVLSVTML